MRNFAVAAALLLLTSCSAMDPYAEAKEAVREVLRDPGSAKFSDVDRCGKSEIVHGKVSAKNAYGAYSGDHSFYVDGLTATVIVMGDWKTSAVDDDYALLHQNSVDRDIEVMKRCTAGITATLSPEEQKRAAQEDREREELFNPPPLPAVEPSKAREDGESAPSTADEPAMDDISPADTFSEAEDVEQAPRRSAAAAAENGAAGSRADDIEERWLRTRLRPETNEATKNGEETANGS
jgi:hypothetical protein